MATVGRQRRARPLVVVLVLIGLTLVTLSVRGGGGGAVAGLRGAVRDVLAPVDRAARAVVRPVGDAIGAASAYGSLRAENARLREEITRLEANRATAGVDRGALDQLSALDHLPFAGNLPTVPAEVVAPVASNFELALELDRGTASGVRVGMPVVSGTGLVGRVVEVSGEASTVLLLTDPTFRVGVRIGTHNVYGVAAGNGSSAAMPVSFVPNRSAVRRGDVAVTALVQDGTFPPGIPVGTVSSARQPLGSLQEQVSVAPFVDPSSLLFVDVVRWLPGDPP